MPPTVSPWPCQSAAPRRTSGPNDTVPRSRTRMGFRSWLPREHFKIGERAQIAQSANHVLGAVHVEHVAAHFVGTLADAIDDGGRGDAIREELLRIEIHLVLAHESADARYFRDTGYGSS